MRYTFADGHTGALFRLHIGESKLGRDVFKERDEAPLTIVWNRANEEQRFSVDGMPTALEPDELIAFTTNQTFAFNPADDLIAWQFNREFYCIIDHDREVSCYGLLFYGTHGAARVQLNDLEVKRFNLLLAVFEDEFHEADNLQGEMLRMLLKRLIVKLTRIFKLQHVSEDLNPEEVDLIREYGLLVETHYRTKHRVQDYAALLHRSPKTLANVFGKHGDHTPLQIIHARIALEAKRRLLYTQDSAAEIGYTLGFDQPAHFSRFFKRVVGQSPLGYRTKAEVE